MSPTFKPRAPHGMRLRLTLSAHEGPVRAVAWSPDGGQLATAGQDHTVRLFDAETGQLLRSLRRHRAPASALAFSPDGAQLASGDDAGTLILWQLDTAEATLAQDHLSDGVAALAWSPRGEQLAAACGPQLFLWSARSGELRQETCLAHDGPLSLAFSPDGALLAIASSSGILLRDSEGGAMRQHDIHAPLSSCIAWSSDGSALLVGGTSGTVRVMSLDGGSRLLAELAAAVCSIAPLSDGRLVAARSGRGEVRIVDGETGRAVALVPEADAPTRAPLACHPRAPLVAVPADHDRVIRVWSLDVAILLSQGSTDAVAPPPEAPSNPVVPAVAAPSSQHDFDVFFCHDDADRDAIAHINLLRARLQERGLRPWIDHLDLRPGTPQARGIEEQIKRIPAAAIFIGQRGLVAWQTLEVDALLRGFLRRGCPVIPVLLAGCPPSPALPAFLEGMTPVDFRQADPDPFERLVWGITGRRSDG